MGEKKVISNALTFLHQRSYQGKPERIAALQQARINDEVAIKVVLISLQKKEWKKFSISNPKVHRLKLIR